jgi:hypothetical protein
MFNEKENKLRDCIRDQFDGSNQNSIIAYIADGIGQKDLDKVNFYMDGVQFSTTNMIFNELGDHPDDLWFLEQMPIVCQIYIFNLMKLEASVWEVTEVITDVFDIERFRYLGRPGHVWEEDRQKEFEEELHSSLEAYFQQEQPGLLQEFYNLSRINLDLDKLENKILFDNIEL